MTETLKQKLADLKVPENIIDLLNSHFLLFVIGAVILLGLLAFFGYRFFKAILIIGGGVGAGYAGGVYLAEHVEKFITDRGLELDFIDWTFAVALVCAIIGALLVAFAYRAIIFLGGGAAGGYVGYTVIAPKLAEKLPDVALLQSQVGTILVAVLLGLVCALVFLLLFKFIFIVATSLGGMAGAIFLAVYAVYPTVPQMIAIGILAVGAVIGIFPMLRQFKADNRKYGLRY